MRKFQSKFLMKYPEILLISLLIATIGLTAACNSSSVAQGGGASRHYYIAAEEVIWDFAPSGHDLINGGPIPKPYYTKWSMVRFIEYTDEKFTTRKPQPDWLGIMGPIVRAEVGDTVIVHFLNRLVDTTVCILMASGTIRTMRGLNIIRRALGGEGTTGWKLYLYLVC